MRTEPQSVWMQRKHHLLWFIEACISVAFSVVRWCVRLLPPCDSVIYRYKLALLKKRQKNIISTYQKMGNNILPLQLATTRWRSTVYTKTRIAFRVRVPCLPLSSPSFRAHSCCMNACTCVRVREFVGFFCHFDVILTLKGWLKRWQAFTMYTLGGVRFIDLLTCTWSTPTGMECDGRI